MPVTVKFRLDFLVCGLQGKLLWNLAKSAPCFHVTKAMKQWTIVEIEFLATVGSKWGCQPFSCPCSKNVPHCRKEICSTCLSKESIPAIPFWNSEHPLLTRSLRFPRAPVQYAPSALHYGCIMPIPSLHLQKKDVCHEKQRVWSRSCGVQDCYNGMRLLQTNEHLSRLSF